MSFPKYLKKRSTLPYYQQSIPIAQTKGHNYPTQVLILDRGKFLTEGKQSYVKLQNIWDVHHPGKTMEAIGQKSRSIVGARGDCVDEEECIEYGIKWSHKMHNGAILPVMAAKIL